MPTATAPPPPAPAHLKSPRRYANVADLLHSLGDVPPERVVLDPPPGTATEADLIRLVEGEPKRLCELVDGTLVEKAMSVPSSYVAALLSYFLNGHVIPRGDGFVTGADGMMRMTGRRVRISDVSFVSFDRVPDRLVPAEPILNFAPDLAVEVLSPGNTRREIAQKLREYFAGGTRLAWIVDPLARTVAVHHAPGEPARVLAAADRLDGEDVLPGFSLAVIDLFRNLPAAADGGE